MTPEEEKNETDAVQTPPEEPKQAANPEPPQQMDPPPKDEKSRSRPVKVYLTVMFCVALLLLMISFVMQQRNHLALQDLNQSISVSQDVADLQMENQKLQYELKEKEDQAEDLQAQLEKPRSRPRLWNGSAGSRRRSARLTPKPERWWRNLRKRDWRAACPHSPWSRAVPPRQKHIGAFTRCCFKNPPCFT